MLFNNILRNNPNKYTGYISVDDIPKGAPIEILDTVCVGTGMSGNEDSEDCISKGGQLVKIKNKTTKIKLELTPDNDIDIDKVDDKDLYYKKKPIRIPNGTIPSNINDYNNNVKNNTNTNTVPQTTGITYNIGQESTNILNSIETSLGFNPQPTSYNSNVTNSNVTNITSSNIPSSNIPSITINTNINSEHPPMYDDTVLHKCKQDAIRNSEKIVNTTIAQTQPQTTMASITIYSIIDTYKIPLIIVSIIVILLIIGIIINKVMSNNV